MDRYALSRATAVIPGWAVVACVVFGACREPPPQQTDAKTDAKTDARTDAKTGAKHVHDAKAITAPGIGAQLVKAQRQSACVQAMQLRQAVEMFRMSERGECPSSVAALVEGKYLSDLPKDPWRHEYTIECQGEVITVKSPGPDGKTGTEDDVVHNGSDGACGV